MIHPDSGRNSGRKPQLPILLVLLLSACGGSGGSSPPAFDDVDLHGNPPNVPGCPAGASTSLLTPSPGSVLLGGGNGRSWIEQGGLGEGRLRSVQESMAVASSDGRSSVVVSLSENQHEIQAVCMRSGGQLRVNASLDAPWLIEIIPGLETQAFFRRYTTEYVGRGAYRAQFEAGSTHPSQRRRFAPADASVEIYRTSEGLIEMLFQLPVPGGSTTLKIVYEFIPHATPFSVTVRPAPRTPRRALVRARSGYLGIPDGVYRYDGSVTLLRSRSRGRQAEFEVRHVPGSDPMPFREEGMDQGFGAHGTQPVIMGFTKQGARFWGLTFGNVRASFRGQPGDRTASVSHSNASSLVDCNEQKISADACGLTAEYLSGSLPLRGHRFEGGRLYLEYGTSSGDVEIFVTVFLVRVS